MEILSTLTPAETLLILKESDVKFKELLKYTFLDLLLKQVIKVKEIKTRAHKNEPVRTNNYVVVGKSFTSHNRLAHEKVFLKMFDKNQSIQVLFRHFVKAGFENASERKNYILSYLVINPDMKGYFKTGLISYVLGRIKLTEKGQEIKAVIQNEINQIEEALPQWIQTDKSKAVALLTALQGNVFLLQNFDMDVLKNFDSEFQKEFERHNQADGFWTNNSWIDFDMYDHSFESSYDTFSDVVSGCSGCSGCGGCGGCD